MVATQQVQGKMWYEAKQGMACRFDTSNRWLCLRILSIYEDSNILNINHTTEATVGMDLTNKAN
jgi:hypothetical protein